MTQRQTPIPTEASFPKTHTVKESMPALKDVYTATDEFWYNLSRIPDTTLSLSQTLRQVREIVETFEEIASEVTPARTISSEEPGAAMIDAETIHTRDTDTAWTQQAWETRRVDPLLRPYLGMYVAVFEAQVVAQGTSRDDVRNKAFQAMNGTVPADRFVIDYWDDEE